LAFGWGDISLLYQHEFFRHESLRGYRVSHFLCMRIVVVLFGSIFCCL
jgi:hypothetical protein